MTEIKVIADIEHENLVKLYGCCAEGDHRILVYNYLENNSLAQTLIGNFSHSRLIFEVLLVPEYYTGCLLATVEEWILYRNAA